MFLLNILLTVIGVPLFLSNGITLIKNIVNEENKVDRINVYLMIIGFLLIILGIII